MSDVDQPGLDLEMKESAYLTDAEKRSSIKSSHASETLAEKRKSITEDGAARTSKIEATDLNTAQSVSAKKSPREDISPDIEKFTAFQSRTKEKSKSIDETKSKTHTFLSEADICLDEQDTQDMQYELDENKEKSIESGLFSKRFKHAAKTIIRELESKKQDLTIVSKDTIKKEDFDIEKKDSSNEISLQKLNEGSPSIKSSLKTDEKFVKSISMKQKSSRNIEKSIASGSWKGLDKKNDNITLKSVSSVKVESKPKKIESFEGPTTKVNGNEVKNSCTSKVTQEKSVTWTSGKKTYSQTGEEESILSSNERAKIEEELAESPSSRQPSSSVARKSSKSISFKRSRNRTDEESFKIKFSQQHSKNAAEESEKQRSLKQQSMKTMSDVESRGKIDLSSIKSKPSQGMEKKKNENALEEKSSIKLEDKPITSNSSNKKPKLSTEAKSTKSIHESKRIYSGSTKSPSLIQSRKTSFEKSVKSDSERQYLRKTEEKPLQSNLQKQVSKKILSGNDDTKQSNIRLSEKSARSVSLKVTSKKNDKKMFRNLSSREPTSKSRSFEKSDIRKKDDLQKTISPKKSQEDICEKYLNEETLSTSTKKPMNSRLNVCSTELATENSVTKEFILTLSPESNKQEKIFISGTEELSQTDRRKELKLEDTKISQISKQNIKLPEDSGLGTSDNKLFKSTEYSPFWEMRSSDFDTPQPLTSTKSSYENVNHSELNYTMEENEEIPVSKKVYDSPIDKISSFGQSFVESESERMLKKSDNSIDPEFTTNSLKESSVDYKPIFDSVEEKSLRSNAKKHSKIQLLTDHDSKSRESGRTWSKFATEESSRTKDQVDSLPTQCSSAKRISEIAARGLSIKSDKRTEQQDEKEFTLANEDISSNPQLGNVITKELETSSKSEVEKLISKTHETDQIITPVESNVDRELPLPSNVEPYSERTESRFNRRLTTDSSVDTSPRESLTTSKQYNKKESLIISPVDSGKIEQSLIHLKHSSGGVSERSISEMLRQASATSVTKEIEEIQHIKDDKGVAFSKSTSHINLTDLKQDTSSKLRKTKEKVSTNTQVSVPIDSTEANGIYFKIKYYEIICKLC